MIICLTAIIWLGVNKNSEPDNSSDPADEIVSVTTSVTTQINSTAASTIQTTFVSSSTATEAVAVNNEALSEIFDKSGHDPDDIKDSQQLITVESNGTACQVKLFEINNGQWENVLISSGVVGKNGVSAKSREGDYCTPEGMYSLGFAFGTEAVDDISVEYRQINENCYWIDDPESPYYNQWVESNEINWNSAEHLSEYRQAYKYAVVINYNMTPTVKGKGSAIFLHCMTGAYTAGCVGIPEEDMIYVLHWLDREKTPVILIC